MLEKPWNFIHTEEKYEDMVDFYLIEIIYLTMKERDGNIICTRLGLVDGEPKTLQETGDDFGVSRERIRQIEVKFYKRLRFYSKKASSDVYSAIKNLQSLLSIWLSPENHGNPLFVATLLQRLSKVHYLKLIISLFHDSKEAAQKEIEYRLMIKETINLQKKILRDSNNQKKTFGKLFNDVAWPITTKKIDITKLSLVKPKRPVNRDNGHITGEFFSEKNNRTIEYESNIEYEFCMYLELLRDVRGYVQQPVKIPYTVNGIQKFYYPDFLVTFEDGRCVLVEIKPRSHMVHFQNLLKYIFLQKYCISNGYGYLITENYHSINKLIHYRIDKHQLNELNNKIKINPIKWLQFKRIMRELSLTNFESYALILHGDLKLTTAPYTISFSDVSFQEFIKLHKEMTLSPFNEAEGLISRKPTKINREKIDRKNNVTLDQQSVFHGRIESAISLTKHSLDDEKKEGYITNIVKRNKTLGLPINSNSKWTTVEENILIKRFKEGMSIKQISELHERKEGGIRSRLIKLGLIE